MSKEEFLKIQTCVLKVNIHCDGCKQKVKKILQKIDGVYTTNIDSEQGKVTVSGNVDPATLIKKLTKNGKHAEIWGVSKANKNNQNQMNNQFKNQQIDSGSKGGQNKGQAPKGGGNNHPKGGLQAQNPQFQQQQLKGLQDLKMAPQFVKDLKGANNNNNKDQNQKSVKFNLPVDEGFSDDDFDDDDFYDEDDEDFDDEVDDFPVVNNKMNPPVLGYGHGGTQTGNIMMNNIMNGQHPQFMKGGGNNGENGGENGKKGGGGGGNMPVQMNLGGGNQNQGGANGGKKGGNGNNNGGNQNQGGGKGGKNGGGQPNDGKNGGVGGGGAGAMNGNNFMGNGAKKVVAMNDGPHGMPNMMPVSAGGHVGPLGTNMPMGQLGNLPMGQMNNLAAVQGLPASAMAGGGGPGAGAGAGAGAGYFPAATPEHMTANPYYQQQLAAMTMNQQRANGNERFQPMMYARPPPAVNYMPPYPPYHYHYAPPHGERIDQYAMFSDENTSSCNVM